LLDHFNGFIREPNTFPEFLAHGITYLKPKIPILKIHQNIGQSHVCPQFIKLCIKVIIYDHCQKLNILNEEQKGPLCPLWFCLAISLLTNLLNSTGYGFNIRLNNTTLSKLNHLLYMDDIKLYASKKNHILSLLTITENFSNDIGMSFGIDKCKTQSICRGHYENLEYTELADQI
jgi:hypothetical protein